VGVPVVGELDVGPRLVDGAVEGVSEEGAASDGEALLGTAVHASMLHTADSNGVGQACATPAVGAVTTTRVRACTPPPQAAEQLLQLVQSPTPQSVHTTTEHAVLPERDGHVKPPPNAISLTERQR